MFFLTDFEFKFDETSFYSILITQHRGPRLLKAYSLIQTNSNKKKSLDQAVDEEVEDLSETNEESELSEDEEEFNKLEKMFNV